MAVHALSNDFNNRSVTYRSLTGRNVTDAVITSDRDFDAHVFACLLAVGTMEGGVLAERLGLCCEDLAALVERRFPRARALSAWHVRGTGNEDDELVACGPDDDDEEFERKVMILDSPGNCIGCGSCARVCPKGCQTHKKASVLAAA